MSVSIVLAKPLAGENERKFKTGAELAKWIWDNCPYIFSGLKKGEQRD